VRFSARIFCFLREIVLLINIENLSFAYPDSLENIFSGLNLSLDTCWRLGIVGDNGRGKSTFLKLLCGEIYGEGKITTNARFNRFPQYVDDVNKTPYELFFDFNADGEFWRLRRECNLIGLDEEALYRPYMTLSGGEQTKFLLAAAFSREGVALVDEPTDHLDLQGRERVAEYLNGKNGFIVVSHDRTFLDGCCERILAFEKAGVFLAKGNYSVYRAEADKRRTAEAVKKEKLENERAKLARSAARASRWGENAESAISNKNEKIVDMHAAIDRGYLTAKAAKTQKRAVVIADRYGRAAEGIKEILKGMGGEAEELRLQPQKFFRKDLVKLKDICVRTGQKSILSGLDFCLFEGERVAVTGGNGCGKSTLLKLICGILGRQFEIEGEISLPASLKISYVPQTCEDEGYLGAYAQKYGIEEGYFKAILNKFGFDKKDFDRDISAFSQGQKKKTALARSLCEKANIYIWDEPLNYLDISSREQIERALISSGATVLFVEHDASFIKNASTRIFEIK